MMVTVQRLNVFLNSDLVGTVYDTMPISFEYAPSWLSAEGAFPVAAIPLQAGRISSAEVPAFFENLLPEGDLRQYIVAQKKASTLFSLIREVAGDTAGAFVILPPEHVPEQPFYERTSWEVLAYQLSQPSGMAINVQGNDARISLAGAQDKISIAIFDDDTPCLPKGSAPSTHIMKPDIKRFPGIWHSAINETIVMLTAAHCGLPTADVFYEPQSQSCIVRRFDRFREPDGSLGRIIQYDFCQLAAVASDKKYEKEGGLTITACANLIRQYSIQPAVDLRDFLLWLFFNLYVGNNDSHAKNVSMYQEAGYGMTLAPFYDLMCTRLYPGLSREFAFSIGGEFKPGSITREHVQGLAQQLDMHPQFVLQQAADLAERIPAAVDRAIETVQPQLFESARIMAQRLQQFIISTTAKTAVRLRSHP